jgi:hypothetical protein
MSDLTRCEPVLELNQVPEIYADGIGKCTPAGPNVKLQLWSWSDVNGIVQRVSVATIIRPFDSLVLSQEDVLRRVKIAHQQMLQGGAWHLIWLTAFDWYELAPLLLLH